MEENKERVRRGRSLLCRRQRSSEEREGKRDSEGLDRQVAVSEGICVFMCFEIKKPSMTYDNSLVFIHLLTKESTDSYSIAVIIKY